MYEYKITYGNGYAARSVLGILGAKLEHDMNTLAKQGWRLISAHVVNPDRRGEDTMFIWEREVKA
jgi:hypothetical protein